MSALLSEAARAPALLTPDRLAEAVAVMLSDLLSVLPGHKGLETRERLANRLHERGALPDGTEAAQLLGAVAGALIRLEG